MNKGILYLVYLYSQPLKQKVKESNKITEEKVLSVQKNQKEDDIIQKTEQNSDKKSSISKDNANIQHSEKVTLPSQPVSNKAGNTHPPLGQNSKSGYPSLFGRNSNQKNYQERRSKN